MWRSLFVEQNVLIIMPMNGQGIYFKNKEEDISGNHITQVFPELTDTLDCFRTRKTILGKEINFSQRFTAAVKLIVDSIILPNTQDHQPPMIITMSEVKTSI
jgi:hypothetical protein